VSGDLIQSPDLDEFRIVLMKSLSEISHVINFYEDLISRWRDISESVEMPYFAMLKNSS